MSLPSGSQIRAIVFDLDGTLYVSDEFAATIQEQAADYIAALLGVSSAEARRSIATTRQRLTAQSGTVQPLSAVCGALGGSIAALHDHFRTHLCPESFLKRDERVIALLDLLGKNCGLFVFTNNNRPLSLRILRHLGLEGYFRAIFTIDDCWRSKPDMVRLEQVLREIGLPAGEVLFVGDRYDVDLALPERQGCPVFLSRTVDQLLSLDTILRIHPAKGDTDMSESKEMLDAIMRAMELEKETFDFYTRAEHKTFNPAGKRIFSWLARTEEGHYLKLNDLYNSLRESGRWVFYAGSTFDLAPAGAGERQVTFDTDDIEALKIASEIEKRGIAYYEELITRAKDPDGKAMMETLRNEEIEHLRVIGEKLGELS